MALIYSSGPSFFHLKLQRSTAVSAAQTSVCVLLILVLTRNPKPTQNRAHGTASVSARNLCGSRHTRHNPAFSNRLFSRSRGGMPVATTTLKRVLLILIRTEAPYTAVPAYILQAADRGCVMPGLAQ
jgi:hypothetical protein